jgi:hypothetical protein
MKRCPSGRPGETARGVFFGRGHLLFNNCPKTLMDKIEQIGR